MKNDLDYKTKLDIIFLDFVKLLSKKGMIKEDITIKQILEIGHELRETPGFYDFVHDFLCDKCYEH